MFTIVDSLPEIESSPDGSSSKPKSNRKGLATDADGIELLTCYHRSNELLIWDWIHFRHSSDAEKVYSERRESLCGEVGVCGDFYLSWPSVLH